MAKYTYTKDDGSTSERELHIVSKPPAQNWRAIDLTGLDAEQQSQIVELYDEWKNTHAKQYAANLREFSKANEKTFEAFLQENGIEKPPTVKAFKDAGLVAVMQG
ncbi:hypothetical protein FDI24_gp066 [Acidovorax phage ACP17]|uniref:Uncharacterized protein n=1 Tax=Acidovorax phage ACP17 TaxID=2010329 RepID=A0A223AJ18_9CAUD|nr:hypothetical protein FDI24_gp066 [Acidovorax phage ACP17]ASS33931.1 hypothetical protein [Acidovorax phage ACP17]